MLKNIGLLLTLLVTTSLPLVAQAAPFQEGQDYKLLSKPQSTIDKDKVEVREFFWYGCPHCYHFEPTLAAWLKKLPSDVAFVRTPAVFRESWKAHAKAYFAAETLGVTDKIHADLFDAYHQKGKKTDTEEALAAFFVERGVDEKEFHKTFNGFFVDMKLRDAMAKPAKYGITGVPAVVVNGKYRVTGSMAKGYPRMIEIIDFLIEKERKP
ncbi:MAG: thiol:disulfide interchange protein DsbA/DsbL, partial [Gammaproteobacteria bacterium]